MGWPSQPPRNKAHLANFYLGIKTKQIKTKVMNVQWPDV